MLTAPAIRQRKYPGDGHFELLEHAISLAKVDGFFAEFSVFEGASLGFIARQINRVVYGFDSFEGRPETWSASIRKGAFSLGGNAPTITNIRFRNFRLVKGDFRESLPTFTAQVAGQTAFLLLDCNVHDSTADVLEALDDRTGSGTVIVLRQHFNLPGWEQGQFRALRDYCQRTGRKYRYEAFSAMGTSVAIVVE